jgi:hypothetical protein
LHMLNETRAIQALGLFPRSDATTEIVAPPKQEPEGLRALPH